MKIYGICEAKQNTSTQQQSAAGTIINEIRENLCGYRCITLYMMYDVRCIQIYTAHQTITSNI